MSASMIGSDWMGHVVDGRFPLLRWLGGAGPESVFVTQLGDPPESATIKLIPADTTAPESLLAQWTAATSLSHPHLMRLFHAGRSSVDTRDLLYAVTEHSEEVLSDILPTRPLTPAEVREMLDPILNTLSWLHRQGLVHGGLRPANIMVVNDQLKLSADQVQSVGPRVKALISADIHDAPESAEEINPAADVWSLGVLLVEALTQQPPQWDGTRSADPVIPGSIPEPFATIARQCLRLDPVRRCTLAEIKSLLAPSAEPVPAQAPPAMSGPEMPAATLEPPARIPAAPSVDAGAKPSFNWRATLAIVAALLIVAAVGAILATRHSGSPSSHSARRSATTASPAPALDTATGPTIPGAVVHRTLPDVPRSAADTIHGHVRVSVRVQVDASGNVSNADFESRGPSRYFANLALNAARSWKFRPAQAHGRAVPSTWLVHFAFGRTGTEVTSAETTP